MVVLNKIYTKTGDYGETALGNGARVAKHSMRVTAYCTVMKPTPPSAWRGCTPPVRWMPNWLAFKTICLIWAPIFAAPIWNAITKAPIHRCAWPQRKSHGLKPRLT